MNKYESVVIIDPAVEEDKVKELSQKFTDIINNDGKVEKVEDVLKEGDMIDVKLIEIDKKTGKLKLSRKVLLEKPEKPEIKKNE